MGRTTRTAAFASPTPIQSYQQPGAEQANTPLIGLTSVRLQATVVQMRIRSFAHKGLKGLYEENVEKGLSADIVDKVRKMLAFLDNMQDPEELHSLPSWRAYTLSGDRKGTWSLSITRNRRLTFRIDSAEREICDLNLEDYH